MKFGTTLFSHMLEWLSPRYSLEQLVACIKAEGIGPGLEIIGFQTIRNFPNVSDDFVHELRDLMDKHELVPTCLGANIDVAMHRDSFLTTDGTVDYVGA